MLDALKKYIVITTSDSYIGTTKSLFMHIGMACVYDVYYNLYKHTNSGHF